MKLKPTDVARADTIRLAIKAADLARPPKEIKGSAETRQNKKEWFAQQATIKKSLRYVLENGTVYTPIIEEHKNGCYEQN